MRNLLITVSGGRSSARMARHIQTHPCIYSKYNFSNLWWTYYCLEFIYVISFK